MKKETIKSLTHKYKQGETSKEEENFLIENAKISDKSIHSWLAPLKSNKEQIESQKGKISWDSFENKIEKKRKFKFGLVIAAAASFALIATLSLGTPTENELSYAEKELLLNEALNMYKSKEVVLKSEQILYEDDMVIIYTNN
jgi:hypothetical protein